MIKSSTDFHSIHLSIFIRQKVSEQSEFKKKQYKI